MPEIGFSLKVIRKRYLGGLQKGLLRAIYRAYSRFNREAYKQIIITAPVSRTPSTRFPAGFVSSEIKLVTKRQPPYTYEEVDIPGKAVVGSRAWRAWVTIRALHEGWTSLPFERVPTRRRVLRMPLQTGQVIYRPKAVQATQITKNPWISRAWTSIEPKFPGILEEEIAKEKKEKKTEKMA